MPFLSQSLQLILDFGRGLDEDLDLGNLRRPVAEAFGAKAELAWALLQLATGRMKRGALGLHLLEVLKHDSAVRDIQTTGHLAKFLGRFEVFCETHDYRLVGMPNPLFDELSQRERNKYFEHGASLELDGDAFESPAAQEMIKRESAILKTFGPP